ncbi:MAG: PilT/PilU family type 4a pilus ATPase [Gammaproteobacteria bacterium]|nr:PilT/PilU family type 4a pilus ATPase [Gammaproteobacteria bacterium]
MELTRYLQAMVTHGASDLFFSVGAPPHIKIEGIPRHIGDKPLGDDDVHELAYSVMTDKQQATFERDLEMNLAFAVPDLGRFRVNVYRQRGTVAMVVRYITNKIPSLESLNLPEALGELVMLPRGLVLVVGSTGSGKSTTLASMIDHRNQHGRGHILTIEDPIEFLHEHGRCLVDQREVGLDTQSFHNALHNAMREAPDVIMIGEIRDQETMHQAIAYAETGHLCLSTMHANNANQALDRIINFFPETQHRQVLMDLSLNLRAIVAQRLLVGRTAKRVPAVEILLNSPFIADLVRTGKLDEIKGAMVRSKERGMLTFDESLYGLYHAGKITAKQAIENADSRTDLAVRIRLESVDAAAPSGLSLSEEEPNTDLK